MFAKLRRGEFSKCLVAFSFLCIGAANLTIAQPEFQYEITVSKNVMVTMRDGVRLATDVYLPTRNGQTAHEKFPAILERTMYNKDGGVPDSSGHIPPSPAEYLVARG